MITDFEATVLIDTLDETTTLPVAIESTTSMDEETVEILVDDRVATGG